VGSLTAPAADAPRTFTLDAGGLVAARARLSRGDAALIGPGDALCAEAEQLLALKPASVMDKTSLAASGDRHDYFSLAPYWWPDPAKPDGSQPQELRRTRSLNYVLFNLEALVTLARLGEHVRLDLWKFSTADGRSLPAAVRVVAPFADPAKTWIKQDLDAADRAKILPLLAEALRHGGDAPLRELFTRFAGTPLPAEHWRLWTLTSP
jgi:hypothetical protein